MKILSLCNKQFRYYSEFTNLPVMQFCLIVAYVCACIMCIYISTLAHSMHSLNDGIVNEHMI